MVQTLTIYFIASIILFLLLKYLDKITNQNFYHSIIITQIYLLFLSGFFTTYNITKNNNIFLIPLFELFFKIFIYYYVEENQKSTNNLIILKRDCISIITSYLITIFFINKVDNVFLNTSEFKILIWITITIYLYINIKKYLAISNYKNNLLKIKDGEYIVVEYAKLKNKYQKSIHTKYKELIPVIYALMIYENYKKPLLLRKIDIFLYKVDKEKRKYGIMQIPSKYPISDEKSIIIAIKKLERIYKTLPNKKDKILELLKKYNYKDNSNEVFFIYNKIILFQNEH